jgi:hypothetical protein
MALAAKLAARTCLPSACGSQPEAGCEGQLSEEKRLQASKIVSLSGKTSGGKGKFSLTFGAVKGSQVGR